MRCMRRRANGRKHRPDGERLNSQIATKLPSLAPDPGVLPWQCSWAGQASYQHSGRASPKLSQHCKQQRCNTVFLPDIRLPDSVKVSGNLAEVVSQHRDLLICVPSHVFRKVLEIIKPDLVHGVRVAWATKGFELSTGKLPHQVAHETLGLETPLAVVSGPTFANEVGLGLPTAMTVAATNPDYADELAWRFSDRNFRAYTSADMVGVEVGGAVKNILAIATGLV